MTHCILLLNTCNNPANKTMNNPESPTSDKEVIILNEKAADALSQTPVASGDFDYVVSEAAVGNIGGVPFTLDGIYSTEKDGKKVPTTTMDINKQRFVDIFEGSIVELKEGLSVKIFKIEEGEGDSKGKVYFKVLEKREK